MESREQILKEKRLTNRLKGATTLVKDIERERIWALAAAHSEGLSIRKIAEITDLSSSRVHQLLHTDEARQIPDWLISGQDADIRRNESSDEEKKPSLFELQQQLADEGEVIRWLEQLARGEKVVVNLRASIDPRTAYVGVNQDWVLRVLKRVAANLDQLSGSQNPIEESEVEANPVIAGVKHRHRLAKRRARIVVSQSARTTSYSERKDGLATNVR